MSVYRVERVPNDFAWDVRAKKVVREMPIWFPKWKDLKVKAQTTELFWIESENSWGDLKGSVCGEILHDPVHTLNQESSMIPNSSTEAWWCIEKSFRPGVTDNAGHVLTEAIDMVARKKVECRTGKRLWLGLPQNISKEEVQRYAKEVFCNELIESVKVFSLDEAQSEDKALFESPASLQVKVEDSGPALEKFDFQALSLAELNDLSTNRLWALSEIELHSIKKYFSLEKREATDVEIEVLAQTWSEHCKHKIFASSIRVLCEREDMELPRFVDSLFKTYIKGSTEKLNLPFLKSVFHDNAGIINITDKYDCAIKVETHNSPSALDPYGGALTGIVGVNRDILGAGMGAEPIANVDVFCVGEPDTKEPLPPKLHHPRRILEGVRSGVEDGGNKSGIPTVTGAVVHHPGFLGKPLVFCGTIGLLPTDRDLIDKKVEDGDVVVMAGGRIGKDGIHGATFSSLELNESSPVSAVQLGDPLTQRRVWDFLVEARDRKLFRAVTDNGAGGLSSSVGEMATLCGSKGGANIDVSKAATKYPGLKPFELVVSESQERMTFAVPPENLSQFLELATDRGVECSALGKFEDTGKFRVQYNQEIVADLDMDFLHNGTPKMVLQAVVEKPNFKAREKRFGAWEVLGEKGFELDLVTGLLKVLSLPNVRSRKSVVEQYDHEVQARSIRKPYGTPNHGAPGDGATLILSEKTFEGLAVGLGLAPAISEFDPKLAAELSVDEALRNAIVAGMDPSHAAFVDNFCWPDPLPSASNPDNKTKLGALVASCKVLHDAALDLEVPFVSGKDSMKNDYRMGGQKISVPPTVLVSVMGKVQDVRKVPKGHALKKQQDIFWISAKDPKPNAHWLPEVDFRVSKNFYRALHSLIHAGKVETLHDISDGGLLVCLSELLFGTGIGANVELAMPWNLGEKEPNWIPPFFESASSFILMTDSSHSSEIESKLSQYYVKKIGATVVGSDIPKLDVKIDTGKDKLEVFWNVSELEKAYES